MRRYGDIGFFNFTIENNPGAPNYNNAYVFQGSPVPSQAGKAPTAWIEYFSQIFAFYTGSIRYKFLFGVSKDYSLYATVTHAMFSSDNLGNVLPFGDNDVGFSVPNTTDVSFLAGMATQTINIAHTQAFEVEIPYASQPLMLMNARFPIQPIDHPELFVNQTLFLTINPSASTLSSASGATPQPVTFKMAVLKAAGDDFMLHLLRPPPMLSWTTSSGTLYYQSGFF
jgi:hypothetical protein